MTMIYVGCSLLSIGTMNVSTSWTVISRGRTVNLEWIVLIDVKYSPQFLHRFSVCFLFKAFCFQLTGYLPGKIRWGSHNRGINHDNEHSVWVQRPCSLTWNCLLLTNWGAVHYQQSLKKYCSSPNIPWKNHIFCTDMLKHLLLHYIYGIRIYWEFSSSGPLLRFIYLCSVFTANPTNPSTFISIQSFTARDCISNRSKLTGIAVFNREPIITTYCRVKTSRMQMLWKCNLNVYLIRSAFIILIYLRRGIEFSVIYWHFLCPELLELPLWLLGRSWSFAVKTFTCLD